MVDSLNYIPRYGTWKRITAAAGSAAALTLGATACESSAPPAPAISQAPDTMDDFDRYNALPYGACRPFPLPNENLKNQRAQECLETRQDSTVALVNFDLPPEAAEEVAKAIETTVAESTHGLLTPDVVAVSASDEAKAAVVQRIQEVPEHCIEEIEDFTSVIADSTMPELGVYDQILGMSNQQACNMSGGQADSRKKRHADIFHARSYWNEFKPGSAILGVIGGHEYLHLEGLGHASRIHGLYKEDSPHLYFNLSKDEIKKDFDLKEFLKDYKYTEYDGSNLMGAGKEKLNGIQQDILRWPEVELGQTQLLVGQEIGAEGIQLPAQEGFTSKYGYIQLAEPMTFRSPISKDLKFTKLAFVPGITELGPKVVFYFVGEPHSTTTIVDAGTIYFRGDEAVQLLLDPQTIKLETSGDTVKINVTNN